MQEKDIKLFDKAIHQLKKLISEVVTERKKYHNRLSNLLESLIKTRNSHDKKMNEILKEQNEILDELYELFDNLYTDRKTGE
jgi:superfamily I DNA and RNA helicase